MKKTVVLIHGTRASSEVWKFQEKFLEKLNYRVISINLPRSGENHDKELTIDNCLKILDKVITDKKNTILIGQSLGSFIVSEYVAKNRVKKVILLSAAVNPTKISLLLKFWKKYGKFFVSKIRRGEDWGIVEEMLSTISRINYFSNIKKSLLIGNKVTIVIGAYDWLRLGQYSLSKITSKENLIIVPKTGHDLHYKTPLLLNNVLTRIMD